MLHHTARSLQDQFCPQALKRWRLDVKEASTEGVVFSERLREWADYNHFAYMSVLALILGGIYGKSEAISHFDRLMELVPPRQVWVSALLLFLVALLSDLRKQAIENWILYRPSN